MIIGDGSHRYEVIDQWGNLPDDLEFGTTHAVVEDAEGYIYVHNTGPQSVIVFEPDGTYVRSWGADYSLGAHGMIVNEEEGREYLYLAATKLGIVAKTTLSGEEIFRITTPDLPDIYDDERKFVPTECAIGPNGDIYIADGYGQPWVHQYTKEATYVRSFGGPGEGKGELLNPHGIKIDERGAEPLIVVADRGNNRLQYFTLAGQHVRFVDHDLRKPCTAVPWRDELYVPDLWSRLTVFDAQDRLVTHLGDRPGCWEQKGWPNLPPEEWVVGAFSSPHDLHVDGSGNIYVAEWLSAGVGKMTKLVRVS